MILNIQLFATDGDISIGVVVDTKSFDEDITELYRKIQENADKQIEIKVEIKNNEQTIRQIEELKERIQNEMFDPSEARDLFSILSGEDEEALSKLEEMTNNFEDAEAIANILNKIIENLNDNIAISRENLANVVYEGEELKKKLKDSKDISKAININSKNIAGKMSNVIKKVARWSLALIGINGIYSMLSQAASQLSTTNKETYESLQHIKMAISTALEPIITKIVGWAKKLLTYINYIYWKMTGKKLFAGAKDNLKKANGEARKLQKTLAGFDEMNVLNSQSSSSSGSNFDSIEDDFDDFDSIGDDVLTKLDAISDVLENLWTVIKNIIEFFKNNFWIVEGVIGAIIGYKLGTKISTLITLLGSGKGLTGILGGAGKGGLIGALVVLDTILITKIVKDVKDKLIPTIKDTNEKIEDAIDLIEKSTEIGKENTTNYVDQAIAQGELNDRVKTNNDLLLEQISSSEKSIQTHHDAISVEGALTQENKLHTEAMEAEQEKIYDNITALGKLSDAGLLTEDQMLSFIGTCQGQIDTLEEQNKKLDENSDEYKKNKKKIEELKTQIDKTKGTYVAKVQGNVEGQQKIDTMQEKINEIAGEHKIVLNASTTKAAKSIYNFLKNGIGSGMFATIFPGLTFATTIANLKKYFAKGGIVNMPGKGIPVAYAGEAGREGVVPLTDSQQMALLGQEIGKWITINLTNNTNLDGRTIARHTSKIQQSKDFAMNR